MANIQNVSAMTKRKLGEETPSTEPSVLSPSPLFSPGLTERQQIALAMKLSGESSQGDNFTTPRPSKINKPNKHGESPLQIAAIKGDLKQVKLLIKQGAAVNARDHAGWSPLHEAACKGYLDVCKMLIKSGAEVNVHGYCDETPLHDAAFNNHPKIVALLLQNGANPLLKNKSGKVPHEIVDNEAIKEMLLNAISGTATKAEGDPLAVYNQSEKQELEDKTVAPDLMKESASSVTPKQLFKSPAKQEKSLPKSESSDPGLGPLVPPAFKLEPEEPPLLVKTEEESDVKNEEGSYSGVSVKEEVEEKEEEVTREEKKEEEPEQPPYFKYSYMIPESTCTTSIAQNGPITLFVARNKRPVKRAPLLECRSPPTTRSRAGGKPVDNTEAEELKCLSEGRYLLKSAVVTPRKKWLHQHATKKRHMGDIYEFQRRGTPAEPPLPSWISSSLLHTKKYLLQSSVAGKLDEQSEESPHIEHIPPIMKEEVEKMSHDNRLLSCKHVADKERLLQQHEQSMLRVRRQSIMKHPTPSACSILLQQQSCEYAKKLQTVSYDVNNDQLLLAMGEKVMKTFTTLAEKLYQRHQQEADTQYASQRFSWVNNIHKYGLYDMPILGNLDLWVERVTVTKLKPHVEYYDEHDPSDSDESNR
ncbi:hypothetical protein ACHWQZ_G011630 [Mnemiopsis leidyi]